MSQQLEKWEKEELLKLARETIKAYFEGRKLPQPQRLSETLQEPRGAFVTLRKGKMLRGCIGYVLPIEPLWLTVRENAINAAFRDPRFEPLQPEELNQVTIEISALTVPERMQDKTKIEIGKDGLIVEGFGRRGLLLPQVAVEYGWDPITFLRETCRKAGLPPDAWQRPEVTVSRFRAEVFAEE